MNVATNIRLPEELLKALKYRAIDEKKSVNRLICEVIAQSLDMVPQTDIHKPGKDTFDNVVGLGKSGNKDGAVKHDQYLYGGKK